MMEFGIFGGTFDPPHLGHLILAAEAADQLGLARVLWVLTPDPPHKKEGARASAEERTALVMAAIADEPRFALSRVDLERPGPHYAADTVRLLQADYPDRGLVYLMGGDSLHDLPTWRRPGELLEVVAGLGVMRRPDDAIDLDALETHLPGIRAKTRFVEAPRLEIASSQVRERIAAGRPYRYYLAPGVYHLIEAQGLYGAGCR